MNYEFLISQGISANLGGTFLQYIITFSLFTFALGFGAIFFQNLKAPYRHTKFLGWIQLVVTLSAAILPGYYHWTDPLKYSESVRPFWLLMNYLPALWMGAVTGFEIPFLMSLETRFPVRVLAFDFIGMFFGTVLFPTVLLYKMGLMGGTLFCALLNLLASFYILMSDKVDIKDSYGETPDVQGNGPATQKVQWAYMLLAFIFSFCSFGYETLVTKLTLSILGDDLLNQVLMVGIFILGLGIGGLLAESKKTKSPGPFLVWLEFSISVFASMLPVLVLIFATYLELRHREFLEAVRALQGWSPQTVLFLIFPLTIGILTGFELPVLFVKLNLKGSEPLAIKLLASNYFGALSAGILCSLILLPLFGVKILITLISLINIFALYFLVFQQPTFNRWQKALIPFFALIVNYAGLALQGPIEDTFLKIHYADLSLPAISTESVKNLSYLLREVGSVRRIESKYQFIDLVMGQDSLLPSTSGNFSLYLNGNPQFGSGNWRTYHESFVWGGINLANKTPKKVLVLGGGDGLLVKILLEVPGIESVELVELDPEMIKLADSHPNFTSLNQNSLQDLKVKVKVADAYRYVRDLASKQELFDAIFIDFPYPTSYDLSRLYSLEFYSNVEKILEAEGFLVMDAPLSRKIDEEDTSDNFRHAVLVSTLRASGFKCVFPYGPFDPLLFVMKTSKSDLDFNYAKIPSSLNNRSWVNLKDIKHIVDVGQYGPEFVNSIYAPKWIQ